MTNLTSRRVAWAEAPTTAPPAPERFAALPPYLMSIASALVVAALGPALHALRDGGVRTAVVVGVLALAACWSGAPEDRSLGSVWLGWAIACGGVALVADATTVAWVLVDLIVARAAILRRPTFPRTAPLGEQAVVPALALTSVAAVAGVLRPDGTLHLVATAAALAVVLAEGRSHGVVGRAVTAIGSAAAALVRWASFAIVGVALVVAPWIVGRVLRVDPLAARATSGWGARGRARVSAGRPWTSDALLRRRSVLRRVRAAVAVPLTIVLLVAGWSWLRPTVAHVVLRPPAAVDGASWWWDYEAELKWAFNGSGGARNTGQFPVLYDVHGRYVNVRHGERVTWLPPACNCPTLRVWMYGGSAVLGWGQRDDHTIPSELARIASAHGVRLEVHNRGIAGDLNWQASQRFAWDVAAQDPPDLVIFYDGYNDLRSAYERNADRSLGLSDEWPVRWNGSPIQDHFNRNKLAQWLFSSPPDGAGRDPIAVPPKVDDIELGRRVAVNYERGRLTASAVAAAERVPAAWFWQPDRLTKPEVDGEPQSDDDIERAERAERAAARAALPREIHDLSGTFDHDPLPEFFDDVHTGERGARVIAERIYDTIEPTLTTLRNAAPS